MPNAIQLASLIDYGSHERSEPWLTVEELPGRFGVHKETGPTVVSDCGRRQAGAPPLEGALRERWRKRGG